MPRYLSIAKELNLRGIVCSLQPGMLFTAISTVIMSGLFTVVVRLHLGLPSLKAFSGMTPLLIAKLSGIAKSVPLRGVYLRL